jgi:PadR family transcriptional regulator PadR
MDIESWKAQLRKGAAELAVLAVLERGDDYGLSILDSVQGQGGLQISEGSIYPLLNRLQKDNKISARWVEEEGASHPRKYYTLTDDGRAFLADMKEGWRLFQRDMSAILGQEPSHA